jgi:Flp pilus assembly protein TadG
MSDASAMQMLSAKKVTSALWRSLRRLASGKADDCRGVAAIEFALVGPMLVVMMVCTVDLGSGIFRKMQVQNAAQAGAIYAALHGFTASSISTAVTSATSFSGISASPAPSQYCGCASNTGITTIDCTSTCTGGSTPGTYVTVSAQGVYATILPYPLLPESFTLTAQSTMRIQ